MRSIFLTVLSCLLVVQFGSALSELLIKEVTEMTTLGGISEVQPEQNSAEIEDLGRFAVEEHNKKEVVKFSALSNFTWSKVVYIKLISIVAYCDENLA